MENRRGKAAGISAGTMYWMSHLTTDPLAPELFYRGERQKKKRNRAAVSCVPCRNRKIKCDRQQPCNSCTGRNRPEECIFRKSDLSTEVNNDDINLILLKRVEKLEGLLKNLCHGHSHQPTSLPTAGQTSENYSSSPIEDSATDELGNIDVALGLMTVHQEQSIYLGPTSVLTIFTEIESIKEVLKQSEKVIPGLCATDELWEIPEFPELVTNTMINSSPINQSVQDKGLLLSLVPSRMEADEIVGHFFQYVQPFFHVLHSPTFMDEYGQFWLNLDVKPEWLGLFFSVLVLGTQSLPEDSPVFLTLGSRSELVVRFYKAVEAALIMSKYLVVSSVTSIQTLLLVFIANESWFAAKHNWALMGVALRLAQRAGLHRDPSLFNLSLLECEMRRRTWTFVLVFNRWSAFHASVLGDVPECTSDTCLPMNVNDVDLISGIPACPSEQTDISLLLLRDQLSKKLYHLLSEAMAIKPPPYSRILEMDGEIQDEVKKLPDYCHFKSTVDSDQSAITILTRYEIEVLCQTTILFIHRPYAVRSQVNPEYTPSCHRCFQAAESLLKQFTEFEKRTSLHENYHWYLGAWYEVYHFHAAVFIALALFACPERPNASELRQYLYVTLRMLNKPCFESDLHRQGFGILLVLCRRAGVEFNPSEGNSPQGHWSAGDTPHPRPVSEDLKTNSFFPQNGSFIKSESIRDDISQGFDWQNWDAMMQSLDASLGVGFTDGRSSF